MIRRNNLDLWCALALASLVGCSDYTNDLNTDDDGHGDGLGPSCFFCRTGARGSLRRDVAISFRLEQVAVDAEPF